MWNKPRWAEWGIFAALAAFLTATLVHAKQATADPAAAKSPSSFKITKLTPPPDPFVSDAQIGQAIDKAQTWLIAQFGADGKIKGYDPKDPKLCSGADALAVYALLQCGLTTGDKRLQPKDAFMKGLLDTLAALPVTTDGTYTRGIRVTALAVANRPQDRATMGSDVKALLDSCGQGTYTYDLPAGWAAKPGIKRDYNAPLQVWDNSNGQYGLLGVWSAAEVGGEIPDEYWLAVQKHWTDCQDADGRWAYGPSNGSIGPSLTWTVAGVASLFVCHEYLDSAKFGTQVGREPFIPPLAKGIDWLETGKNFDAENSIPYTKYGCERVGLASGFKYFGAHDWYREGATNIVHEQSADGSFNWKTWSSNTLVDTSYCLLFLARGRHPVLMNKLRFDHFWDNRPRDLANLCKSVAHDLEGQFNWQVITLKHDWPDWTDSSVLYIASHEPPKLTDEDYAKIRGFVDSGGLLFTQADGNAKAFNDFVEKTLVPRVFKDYELQKLSDKHELYTMMGPFKGNKPHLEMVTNGARLLMVHSPIDLAQWWQQNAKSHQEAFEIGENLFIYASGKKDFRNRLLANYIPPPPPAAPGNTITVARIKYPRPTWDPEPYAWTALANWMGWETSVGVKTQVVEMADLGALSPSDVPLAHLTGTNGYSPTDEQLAALRKYVEAGGVLFIDACGGVNFNDTVTAKIIPKAFPDQKLAPLPAGSPLLKASADGMSDLTLKLRPYAMNVLGATMPSLEYLKAGKGQVIYSSLDVTNGLLNSRTWGVVGYDTPSAQGLMKNLLLWAARGGGGNGAAADSH